MGSNEAAAVEDGDLIRAEPTVDVSEIANSVAMQAKSALAAFQENMEALKQNFLLRGYFNRRGYEDSSDLTKHAVARLPAKAPLREFAYQAGELFDKADSSKLKNPKAFDEAGKFLEDHGFGVVIVAAYTGMVGDTDKDRMLTLAQATVVRDYLVQHFIVDDTRIKTLGLGKAKKNGDSSKIQLLVYASRPPAPPGVKSSSPSH